MSKRAEEAALKVYPPETKKAIELLPKDWNKPKRIAFIQGYEQGEKDTIRTVKTWLSEIHRVCDITDENGYRIELRNLIALLEKTMEEK